jgi:hypothetical protein
MVDAILVGYPTDQFGPRVRPEQWGKYPRGHYDLTRTPQLHIAFLFRITMDKIVKELTVSCTEGVNCILEACGEMWDIWKKYHRMLATLERFTIDQRLRLLQQAHRLLELPGIWKQWAHSSS